MKIFSKIAFFVVAAIAVISMQSCEKTRSYSELLNDENMAVNRFLADQWVIATIPADSVFEVGPEAPYYQLDADGNIYMQVLDAGSGEKVEEEEEEVVRYLRFGN